MILAWTSYALVAIVLIGAAVAATDGYWRARNKHEVAVARAAAVAEAEDVAARRRAVRELCRIQQAATGPTAVIPRQQIGAKR